MKFHVYIKSYDRFDTSTRKTTTTDKKLLAAQEIAKRADDDELEDFEMKQSNADWMLAAFNSDNEGTFSLKKLLKGKRQFIYLEEQSVGIGVTLDEAKLALLAGEEE